MRAARPDTRAQVSAAVVAALALTVGLVAVVIGSRSAPDAGTSGSASLEAGPGAYESWWQSFWSWQRRTGSSQAQSQAESQAPSTVAHPHASAGSAPPAAATSAPSASPTASPSPSPTVARTSARAAEGAPVGVVHRGSYHLGPVEWQGSIHNSCAPYPAAVQSLEGVYLAGVDSSLNGDGSLCDATARVTTRLGRTILVRIVTTGASRAPGDLDLSPAAYAAIHQDDPQGTPADPRPMTWQLVEAPGTRPMVLQYQTGANPWWTSLWVRNPRLPVAGVEVRPSGAAGFTALRRADDGTWNADRGFGPGAFGLRITASDGQVVTQQFAAFRPGALVTMSVQFG